MTAAAAVVQLQQLKASRVASAGCGIRRVLDIPLYEIRRVVDEKLYLRYWRRQQIHVRSPACVSAAEAARDVAG